MSTSRQNLSFSIIISFIALLWASFSAQASPGSIEERCISKWTGNYDNVRITSMKANGDHGVCGSCWFTVNDDNADDGERGIGVRSGCISVPDKQKPGGSCNANTFGNPINVFTGEKTEYALDLQGPQGSLLKWERDYSSISGKWEFPVSLYETPIQEQTPESRSSYIFEPGYRWAYLIVNAGETEYHFFRETEETELIPLNPASKSVQVNFNTPPPASAQTKTKAIAKADRKSVV